MKYLLSANDMCTTYPTDGKPARDNHYERNKYSTKNRRIDIARQARSDSSRSNKKKLKINPTWGL